MYGKRNFSVMDHQAIKEEGSLSASSLQSQEMAMAPWKIMVVDDESAVLSVHCAYLEHMGHEVVACSDSREVLSLYQSHQGNFDMVMTDYRMPHLNGLQLTQMLRLFDAALPVTMVTGFREEVNGHELDRHAIACLEKPLRYAELCRHIGALQQSLPRPG